MVRKISELFKTIWYWLFAAILLLIFFVSKGHTFSQVFFFITFLLPVVIGTAYYVNNILIPEYLLRKRTGLFILYGVYTIIISLYLQFLIIFLSLYLFTSFQLGASSLHTLDVGNLSLTLYILVLINVVFEIVEKLSQKDTLIKSLEQDKVTSSPEVSEKIVVRYNRVNHSIDLSSIVYIESLSDYIKVVTEHEEIVTKEKISKIKERLPNYFKRTHRSYIVNTKKISSYNNAFTTLGDIQIPISRTYKQELIAYLAASS